jgi:4-hydroxy 2-oxovalerate aldolase
MVSEKYMRSKLSNPILIDCTLRDGGYYNNWNFPVNLINNYLIAMNSAKINIVEIGFRFLKNNGFKGACAFSSDNFIRSLKIPNNLTIGVMINASDLYTEIGWKTAMEKLFPEKAKTTPVKLVRIASHYHEVENAFFAIKWLKKRGYRTGLNLMQITDREKDELIKFSKLAQISKPEVIYFADSIGNMKPRDVSKTINLLRKNWKGNIGIHTHDNMGLALSNTMEALNKGVKWLDATVTGMGRGPGNAKMEELIIELDKSNARNINLVPLLSIIRNFFLPLKKKKNWGTNPYYYLSGKYGIHPTYIQVMMDDNKYNDEDILGAIDHLRKNGAKKFQFNDLNIASQFYHENPKGTWSPISLMKNREILILGSGPGVNEHKIELQDFIKNRKPLVLAINIQKDIDPSLVDCYIACHPVRLLAEAENHSKISKPLIAPVSMLNKNLKKKLGNKKIFDFGIKIVPEKFEFSSKHCVVPNSLAISYALAVCLSGKMSKIFMAGFDGYQKGDSRNDEVEEMLINLYKSGISNISDSIIAITPTSYRGLSSKSVYGIKFI